MNQGCSRAKAGNSSFYAYGTGTKTRPRSADRTRTGIFLRGQSESQARNPSGPEPSRTLSRQGSALHGVLSQTGGGGGGAGRGKRRVLLLTSLISTVSRSLGHRQPFLEPLRPHSQITWDWKECLPEGRGWEALLGSPLVARSFL